MATASMQREVEVFPRIGVEWAAGMDGRTALEALLGHSAAYVAMLRERRDSGIRALLGRMRGTLPGASFGAVVAAVEAAYPTELVGPFEGSDNVAGGVLLPERAGLEGREDGFLFLRFGPGTCDLPMHVHEGSERFIYVLEGRGTFHVSDEEDWRSFDGSRMRHVPIRSRDVLLFAREAVHTFSTGDEALMLLSYHSPFVPLADPQQWTVPACRILPAEYVDAAAARPACDPAWVRLA